MNRYQLLSFMDIAVREQLAKINKLKYVSEDTNFTTLLVGALNRYTYMYKDEQAVYDVALDAFEQLFLVNVDKLKYFSGRIGDSKITIEQYLHKLYSREVIDASKAKSEAYKSKQSVTEMDGESSEEAFNRVTMTAKGNKLSMGDIYELDYLEDRVKEISQRMEGIDEGTILVTNKEASLEKLAKDLEKTYKQIDTIRKEGQQFLGDTDNGEFTDEEQTDYSYLLEQVKLKVGTDSKLLKVTLDMLSNGFRQTEIADYFEISKVRVSKAVTKIKAAIYEVALEQNQLGENSMMKLWNSYTECSQNSSNAKLDDEAQINLYRQVHNAFGIDLYDEIRDELEQ